MIKLSKLKTKKFSNNLIILLVSLIVTFSIAINLLFLGESKDLKTANSDLKNTNTSLADDLKTIKDTLSNLQNEDQYKTNQDLKNKIADTNKTFQSAISVYEQLVDLKDKGAKTTDLDKRFSEVLNSLSKVDYQSAQDKLKDLKSEIDKQNTTFLSSTVTKSAPESNTPPSSGYSRQSVKTEAGSFTVSIISADISSTKVIVDTASDSSCSDNCPVLSLSEYISRNGAYAGVNGTYFCPATYPSCVGKTNSFDLLVMNKNRTYFNSDNNVYSSNPAVIFGDNYVRFVSSVSQWGRDTSPNGVLSNYPLLVFNSNVTFGGDDDPKKGSIGNRSFVANKGNNVYIGVVHSATVAESALVMKALGMENAMNLDDGGSTALYSGGYKVGPGRNLPNVLLFVKK